MSSESSANRTHAGMQPFQYQPVGGDASDAAGAGSSEFPWISPDNGRAAAAAAEREKQAFEKGLAEGQARSRAEYEKALAELRNQIAGALRDFTAQRDVYFERVEPEIVQLALAVARKILHREAQMDPLMLAGVVHVALDKLDAGTQVRLRANPAEIRFWREYFSQPRGVRPAPELVGDPALEHSECALETDLGNTTISLDTQVKEIEQGFADLLEQRIRVR